MKFWTGDEYLIAEHLICPCGGEVTHEKFKAGSDIIEAILLIFGIVTIIFPFGILVYYGYHYWREGSECIRCKRCKTVFFYTQTRRQS